jgi:hypothetical protein
MSETEAKLILAIVLAAVVLGAAIVMAWPAPEPEIHESAHGFQPAPAEVSQLIEEARRITREATE